MSGIDEGLDEVGAKLLAEFRAGVGEVAEDLKGESGKQVPFDQGDLDRSAKVTVAPREHGVEAAVSYDTPYAQVQHEDRTLRHQDGRKAGYLGDPMRENADRYQQHIADKVRAVLDG